MPGGSVPTQRFLVAPQSAAMIWRMQLQVVELNQEVIKLILFRCQMQKARVLMQKRLLSAEG